ncbi:MAG: phosphate signaling complex protein PhoU [Cohaesibacteraceae bacterium]|nr:phosphate signaling complex protein PhoU [Cohaesibacteraceae bacterium]MBL4876656.1 phosphate signaling complex protein PhoU [Cohaesibacteraceae bacterium]
MSDHHIVSAFDNDLKDLAGKIAEMGGLAEQLVDQSITSLLRSDVQMAKRVIKQDITINIIQQEIEEKAVLTIARRQPMAGDLREIIAALRISGDLERIGDLGKNIAKRVIRLEGQVQPKELVHGLETVAKLALEQMKAILDAYANADAEMAVQIRDRDDEIDNLYMALFRDLLEYMMKDPRNITYCTHLLFCAKNIERIGDHVTNVAETIHYFVTGDQMVRETRRTSETHDSDGVLIERPLSDNN